MEKYSEKDGQHDEIGKRARIGLDKDDKLQHVCV